MSSDWYPFGGKTVLLVFSQRGVRSLVHENAQGSYPFMIFENKKQFLCSLLQRILERNEVRHQETAWNPHQKIKYKYFY